MRDSKSTIEEDRFRRLLIRIAYFDDIEVVRRLIRHRGHRMSDPRAVLDAATSELVSGERAAFESYTNDPAAVVAVVNEHEEIEALLGGFLSPAVQRMGAGRDLGWLAAHLRTWLPMHAHRGCQESGAAFFIHPPGSPWLAVAEPRVGHKSIVLLSFVAPS